MAFSKQNNLLFITLILFSLNHFSCNSLYLKTNRKTNLIEDFSNLHAYNKFGEPKIFGNWKIKYVDRTKLTIDKVTNNINCDKLVYGECRLNCSFKQKSTISYCAFDSKSHKAECCCFYKGTKNENSKCATIK